MGNEILPRLSPNSHFNLHIKMSKSKLRSKTRLLNTLQVASVAEDEEMAARLQLAQYCEQKLVKMGEILPKEISDRSFRSLLRRSSESGVRMRIEDSFFCCH